MKSLRKNLAEIYTGGHKGLLIVMAGLFLLSLSLFIFSLANLQPSSAIVKVGYGDIGSFAGDDLTGMRLAGGYRDGGWGNMLTFPILALIVGVLHNLIAVRIYKRRGEGIAKAFVVISMTVVIGAFIVLLRLLAEG